MAMDPPIKPRRGRPPSLKAAKSKMEQKMELVHQRLALLDSSSGSDRDDDIEPRAIVIDCDDDDMDDVVEVIPLKMLRPKEVDSEQRAVPVIPQTCNSQNSSIGHTNTTKVPVKGQNKCASVQEFCGSAMERAQEIQTKLPAEHPSFVKYMLHSHVVSGFWLGLPAGFCNKHLPKHDTEIVLEDENGSNHKTNYLGGKQGLKRTSFSVTPRRGRPPSLKAAKSKMEQKMELVHQRLALLDSSSGSDRDDDIEPRAIVIDCDDDDMDDVVEVIPLKMLRPKEVDSEQRAVPVIPQTCNSQNSSIGHTNTTKVPVKGQNKCASVQEFCGSAMERAQEIQTKLPAEHPSFVKYMLHSHVVSGFWLGLPAGFCNKHLPKHDTEIVLEDENGSNHKTNYLGGKQGLSAGWRGFAINHNIKVGGVVVFELVRTTKFKVHIVREKNISTVDGATSLVSSDAFKKRKISKEATDNATKPKEDPKTTRLSSKVAHDDTQNLVCEAIDGIRFSDSEMSFDNVTSFSNFNIIVDGLIIDCKFPDHQRRTYYELCCAQKSFLHNHLLRQLSLTIVVGVIMETINIAEGIRACRAGTSSREDFLVWKKTLQSFELLGMNVTFLLRRVDDLLGLPDHPRDPSECGKYKELKLERSRAGEKMKALESMMSTLKDVLKKNDAEMEEMESSVRNHDIALWKIATAPW